MTTPHPHKNILIAIANGLPVTEVEVKHRTWKHWYNFEDYPHEYDIFKYPTSFEVRIKQKTVMFNGVELPEPVKETPKCGDLMYVPRPDHPDNYVAFHWEDGASCDQTVLARGLVHTTKENAIEWALAMTPVANPLTGAALL